jgi:hypothetical protein
MVCIGLCKSSVTLVMAFKCFIIRIQLPWISSLWEGFWHYSIYNINLVSRELFCTFPGEIPEKCHFEHFITLNSCITAKLLKTPRLLEWGLSLKFLPWSSFSMILWMVNWSSGWLWVTLWCWDLLWYARRREDN